LDFDFEKATVAMAISNAIKGEVVNNAVNL